MIINTGLPLAGGVRFSSGSYSGVDQSALNPTYHPVTIDVGFEPKAFFVCGVPTKSQVSPGNWGYWVLGSAYLSWAVTGSTTTNNAPFSVSGTEVTWSRSFNWEGEDYFWFALG